MRENQDYKYSFDKGWKEKIEENLSKKKDVLTRFKHQIYEFDKNIKE